MALIIPKNNADEQTLDATLKIYYDADDWVENSYLIDNLSSALDNLGKEEFKKEPQSYTKKTQVLAYYGFITWEDVTNPQSRRKITELGRRFYEARLNGSPSGVFDIIIESLNKCTFGRNVIGCNSDSDLEPPNIFLKSALLLEGINLNEFAYILQRMEFDKVELADAIFDVSLKRKMGQSVNPNDSAAKWKDPKPILALGNWGLFFVNKLNGMNHYYLNKDVISTYSKDLMALRTKNTDTIRFKMNKTDDDMDDNEIMSRQIIYYGAPGTGKSNTIKRETESADLDGRVFRTTFHPDSDYSTFVGCFKPSMKPTGVTLASGLKEEVITYKFVAQAFTNAYVKAWNTTEDVFLIIEEINRGNCAQIFGDLFQLLDRKKGISEYPIDADSDLSDYLNTKLEKSNRDFPKGVKEGKKLVLPSNLFIWATMNTSDQSLFPIDSAFKRRWEWKYIPIKNHKDKNYTIEIGKAIYDWWGFLVRINDVINSTTSSEDKKLGYFFAKTEDGVIKAEQFVGKVLFYLWNDVFKNYGFDNPIFEKVDKNKYSFSDFFLADGSPDLANINAFMIQLDEKIKKEEPMIIEKDEDLAKNNLSAEE